MSVPSPIHSIVSKKVHDFNNEQLIERMSSIKSKLKEFEAAMDDLSNIHENNHIQRFRKNLKESLFFKLNKHLKKQIDRNVKMQAPSMAGVIEARITPPSLNERLYIEKDTTIKIVSTKLVVPVSEPVNSSPKDRVEKNSLDNKLNKDIIQVQEVTPHILAGQQLYEKSKLLNNDELINQKIRAQFNNAFVMFCCSEIVISICNALFKDKIFKNEDNANLLSEILAHICFVILLGLPTKNECNIKMLIVSEIQNCGLLNVYQDLFDIAPKLEMHLPGSSESRPTRTPIKAKTEMQTQTQIQIQTNRTNTHSNVNSNDNSYPVSLEHSLNSPSSSTKALPYTPTHAMNNGNQSHAKAKEAAQVIPVKSKWFCCF
jgi:hypothetical protein